MGRRLVVLALLVLGSVDARADDPKAEQHNLAGKVCYGKGDLEGALREFKAAFDAEPQAKYLFNAAKTLEKLGRLDEAFRAYRDYLLRIGGPEEREAAAKSLARLCPDVGGGLVKVVTVPEGAALVVDGAPFPLRAPTSLCLLPGRHELVATRDGYVATTRAIEVAAGGKAEVEIALVVPTRALPPIAPPPTPTMVEPRGTNWGWVTAALAVGLVATGVGLYAVAYDRFSGANALDPEIDGYSDRFDGLVDEGDRYQLGAYACWGLGALMVVPTVLLWPDGEPAPQALAPPAIGSPWMIRYQVSF